MKNFFKKITGLDKVEAEKAQVQEEKLELLKQRDPKAYATRKKEPWVNVIDVKVNEENVRNGFFELDWNEYFIAQLVEAGYGVDNDPEEEIVDRWFRDIVYNMLEEEGQDTNRGAGYINVVPIAKGKSEVS
jgi:hypothetical protein|tara:strand:+ start:109 stop:501 length:393 start_codon:yes stop_codon:yes gene_type:complete